jgi:hypothetical protein
MVMAFRYGEVGSRYSLSSCPAGGVFLTEGWVIRCFIFQIRGVCGLWCCALLLPLLIGVSAQAARIDLGKRSAGQWAWLLTEAAESDDPGRKIARLSSAFLDTPYRENSLLGSSERAEVLVMDLAGVDCFTLLDYLESFRRATRFPDVIDVLQRVRYRDGQLDYRQRNHFFSDWPLRNADRIVDVTGVVGPGRAETAEKQLNLKHNGSRWLAGIPVVARPIVFIPAARIDRQLVAALRSGDYVGIYSERPGLDVSHAGIVIKEGERAWLRHASSQRTLRRVVDSDLLEYLKGTPGVVIYRAR